MTIDLKNLSKLKDGELNFVYSMIMAHSQTSSINLEVKSASHKPKHKKKNYNSSQEGYRHQIPKSNYKVPNNIPDIFNLDDPKWKTCTNEKYLAYYRIMKKMSKEVDY